MGKNECTAAKYFKFNQKNNIKQEIYLVLFFPMTGSLYTISTVQLKSQASQKIIFKMQSLKGINVQI